MNSGTNIAERNLILLHHFQPEVAKGLYEHLRIQREKGIGSPYRVVPTQAGFPTLIKIEGNKRFDLHERESPLAATRMIVQSVQNQTPGVLCVCSSGLGYTPCSLAPLLSRTKVIVVEPEYDILIEALRITDWGKVLPSNRFLVMAGDQAIQQLQDILKTHGSFLKDGIRFVDGRIFEKEERKPFDGLEATALESKDTFQYRKSSPLKVNTSRYAIVSGPAHKELLPVLCEEIKSDEHEARPVFRKRPFLEFMQTEEMWWESLGRPLPAKLLSFSEKVCLPYEWERIKAYGIERYLWCYDDPFRGAVDQHSFNHFDRVYCFDPFLTKRLQKILSKPIHFLPAATTFGQGISGTPPAHLPAQFDVTFIGSTGLQRQDDRLLQLVAKRDSSYQTLEHFVTEQLTQNSRVSYDDLLSLPVEFPGYSKQARVILLQDLATFVIRLHYLTALVGTSAVIFGDQLWAEESMTGAASKLYGGQSTDFLQETPWIYHNSKININTFNVQCVNSPTVRMFDVMACGGFLLNEYRPFLETMFEIGQEIEVFHNRDELLEKINHYLEHEEERKRIASAGCERVLREHRYRDRLRIIFGGK